MSTRNPNMTGKRYGKWRVIGDADCRPKGIIYWPCRCACGTEREVWGPDLRSGRSQNCGCVRRKVLTKRQHTHGRSETRLYARWLGMIARCENPKHRGYANYGGRGIKVCCRWRESFAAFLADMGEPPTPRHQLDRIDNDGHYELGNVRWAMNKENSRNRPSARKLTYQGVTRPLNEWAELVGLNPKTLYKRIVGYGWSVEKAITTPRVHPSAGGRRSKDVS